MSHVQRRFWQFISGFPGRRLVFSHSIHLSRPLLSFRQFSSADLRRERERLGIQPVAIRSSRTRRAEIDVQENAVFTEEIVSWARQGCWDEALDVFEDIAIKNTIVYTAILDAALKCRRFKQGLQLFRRMRKESILMNIATYTCGIWLHVRLGEYDASRRLWEEVLQRSLIIDSAILTSILKAAADAGDIVGVQGLLKEAEEKDWPLDASHFSSLLSAYRQIGDAHGALECVRNMRRRGLKPTIVHYHIAVGIYNRIESPPDRSVIETYVHEICEHMVRDRVAPTERFIEELVRALLGGQKIVDSSDALEKLSAMPEHITDACLRLISKQARGDNSGSASLPSLKELLVKRKNSTDKARTSKTLDAEGNMSEQIATLLCEPARKRKSVAKKPPAIAIRQDPKSLFVAVKGRQNSAIQKLVDAGANIDECDTSGETPLILAAKLGHAESVRALLECGAALEAVDVHCQGALAWSINKQHLKVAELLLSNGASPSPRDAKGWTPLHVACDHGNISLVRCLVQQRAEIRVLSKDRQRPFDIALKQGHWDICKFLRAQ